MFFRCCLFVNSKSLIEADTLSLEVKKIISGEDEDIEVLSRGNLIWDE